MEDSTIEELGEGGCEGLRVYYVALPWLDYFAGVSKSFRVWAKFKSFKQSAIYFDTPA